MDISAIKSQLNSIKRTKFGISIPELRKFAKQIAKEDYHHFLTNNPNDTFELRLLHAFVIGYIKTDINTALSYFKDFIPYVNDWAINDSLCQNFRLARAYRKETWKFLMQYKNSHLEFESRIASVMLLSHFLTDDYIDDTIKILDTLNTDDYYSKMGVAWAVATTMGKYQKKCVKYLTSANCHLDPQTYNKSLQKIRESFRVSKEIKELTKTLTK